MRISPACDVKPVSECEPGTLIRYLGHGPSGWALVCNVVGQPDIKGAVNLGDDRSPSFSLFREPSSLQVLAFAEPPRLLVDMNGPSEPPFAELFEANGAIVRNSTGWFMNVFSEQGQRRQRGTLDLETMTLVDDTERLNNTAVFAKWSLQLGQPRDRDEKPTEIFAFEWRTRRTI